MATIRGIAEIVLNVHDIEAALGFYRDLLGLTVLGSPGPVFLEVGTGQVGVPQMLVLVPMPAGSARVCRSAYATPSRVGGSDPEDFDEIDHICAPWVGAAHGQAPGHPIRNAVRR